jgi:hypothetical protein
MASSMISILWSFAYLKKDWLIWRDLIPASYVIVHTVLNPYPKPNRHIEPVFNAISLVDDVCVFALTPKLYPDILRTRCDLGNGRIIFMILY